MFSTQACLIKNLAILFTCYYYYYYNNNNNNDRITAFDPGQPG